jgi:hypothetical protein
MKIAFLIFAMAVRLAASDVGKSGFEFRGLRTGLNESAIRAALLERHRQESIGKRLPECPYLSGGQVCGVGNYSASLNANGIVWSVNYTFVTKQPESPRSFVEAFTAKYGRPTITVRTYVNAFREIRGQEFLWDRGTQRLSVAEFCGDVETHCVTITDTAYAPKGRPAI